jgi:hypothetical protein
MLNCGISKIGLMCVTNMFVAGSFSSESFTSEKIDIPTRFSLGEGFIV